jgi:hypothetical protein
MENTRSGVHRMNLLNLLNVLNVLNPLPMPRPIRQKGRDFSARISLELATCLLPACCLLAASLGT